MKNLLKHTLLFLSGLSALAFQPVDLNLASIEQIAIVPGIGRKSATDIVLHRERFGLFLGKSDLLKVEGFNYKKLNSIKDKITFSLTSIKPNKIIKPVVVENKVEINKKVDLHRLEQSVLKHHGLMFSTDNSMISRAQKSSLLPKFMAYFDVDQGAWLAEKRIENRDDYKMKRGDRDFSIGVKAIFDLDKLIFNSDELEVHKLSLKRIDKRLQLINRLHKNYFKYLRLIKSIEETNDILIKNSIALELLEVKAALDSLSGGNFSSAVK